MAFLKLSYYKKLHRQDVDYLNIDLFSNQGSVIVYCVMTQEL